MIVTNADVIIGGHIGNLGVSTPSALGVFMRLTRPRVSR